MLRSFRVGLSLAVALAVSLPASASDHVFWHSLRRFFQSWNAHDGSEMGKRWTAAAIVVDPLGRSASGRAAVAQLLTEGNSTFRLTSDVRVIQVGPNVGKNERDIGVEGTVEFDGEISGMRSPEGVLLPPFKRRFTAVLVWAPDLPGGHHPNGRYFISSLRAEPRP